MKPVEYIDNALSLVLERSVISQENIVYSSLISQLEYVKSTLINASIDRSNLHKITIGSIAVKEFEELDPQLARALKDAHYIAVQTGRGLKVDLP